jgi:hypothetical protein
MKCLALTPFLRSEVSEVRGRMSKLNEEDLGRVFQGSTPPRFCMKSSFWKFRFYSLSLAIPTLVSGFAGWTLLSATEPEERSEAGSIRSEEEVPGLPVWEEGDFREGFDVRIWPERIVMWLEQENLRDLIADPRTPGPEKEALKKVLAMQQVWPKRI